MRFNPGAYKTLFLTAIFFLVTIVSYILFLRSSYFQFFLEWSQRNLVLYCVTLFVLKVSAIVYAPLPGGLLTLGSIPVLGWKLAYFIDILGSMVGASIAYFLGKKYGLKFMERIFDQQTIDRIQKIKINKKREIEGVFVLRVLTGSSILDALCYAAGLLNIRYRSFLIGSVLSHLVVGIPAFYLSSNILSVKNFALNGLLILCAVFILYKIKGRYFE